MFEIYYMDFQVQLHDGFIKWKYLLHYWPLWGESTGRRWIPFTKASNAGLWCFLKCAPEQMAEQTGEMLVIWDATALIMKSLQW